LSLDVLQQSVQLLAGSAKVWVRLIAQRQHRDMQMAAKC